jgi:host factor-I protein
MNEINITLPSIRHIHALISNREAPNKEVEIKLMSGDDIKGKLKWVDNHCICVEGAQSGNSHTMLIWHHAIAYIKS